MITKIIGLAAGTILTVAMTKDLVKTINSVSNKEKEEEKEYKKLLKEGIIDMTLHEKYSNTTKRFMLFPKNVRTLKKVEKWCYKNGIKYETLNGNNNGLITVWTTEKVRRIINRKFDIKYSFIVTSTI